MDFIYLALAGLLAWLAFTVVGWVFRIALIAVVVYLVATYFGFEIFAIFGEQNA